MVKMVQLVNWQSCLQKTKMYGFATITRKHKNVSWSNEPAKYVHCF